MDLTSDAFGDQEPLPVKYTEDGENHSPPLRWSDLPERTQELALLFETVTPVTQEPFAQWLAYKIPPDQGGLPEGFRHARAPEAPAALLQGRNDIGNVGYDGPLGTLGRTIRCRFRLFALDTPLEAGPGLDRAALLDAMAGHVIDEADLDVTYTRPAEA